MLDDGGPPGIVLHRRSSSFIVYLISTLAFRSTTLITST